VILLTHMAFRRKLGPASVAALPIRLAFSPYSEVVGLIAIAAVCVSTFFVDGLQYTVPAFAPFLLILSLVYWNLRRKQSL
jgi:L-asparagine transporter-like permease